MSALNTQSARAPVADRGNDLYETPPEAVRALLSVESLPHRIWEPACGPGSIVRVLRAAGHDVIATDLVDYASPDQDESGYDFLMPFPVPVDVGAIVTNPPFKNAEAFVEKALAVAPKVVMLLRLAFIESTKRNAILDDAPLARMYVFRNRLPMMHRAGRGIREAERQSSSALAFAWFVWERGHDGPVALQRLSWEASR